MEEQNIALLPEDKKYLDGYRAGYRDGLAAGLAGITTRPETLALPIEALNLSTRCFNCLHENQYLRIQDLAQITPLQIYRMRNMGKKSANEIARALHRFGVFPTAWDEFVL